MLEEVGKRHGGNPGAAFSFPDAQARKAGWARMSINFSAGDETPADVGDMTETMFREAAEELTRVINQIKAGKFEEVRATPSAVKDLKAAFQLVMEERGRIDKLRKHVAGTVGARALDFHAARDEIGRRLARLRDAGAG